MPNWCSNTVTFEHDDADKVILLATAFNDKKPFMTFMPTPTGEWDYGWCIDNWGTKWDAEPNDAVEAEGNSLLVNFDTAWGPPVKFYDYMTTQGWRIDATYLETGMCFAGHYGDGEDNCYDYDFSNPDWREEIDNEDVLEMLEDEYTCYQEFMEEDMLDDGEDFLEDNDSDSCDDETDDSDGDKTN